MVSPRKIELLHILSEPHAVSGDHAAAAVVRHAGSATLGVASPTAVFHGQRNLEWTWIKNTPRPLLLRTALAHAVYSVAGLAHYAGRGRMQPARKGKLAALRERAAERT